MESQNVTQLTREQAIACSEREDWKRWNPLTRVLFQVHQDRLCMPLEVYHEAIESTLGRLVPIHRLFLDQTELKAELMGLANKSS